MITYENGCVGCPSDMGCLGSSCPYMDMPVACCDRCEDKAEEFYEFDGEYLCEDCYIETMTAAAKTKNGGECCGCCREAETLYELDGEWLCYECFVEAILETGDRVTAEQMIESFC